MHFTSIPALKQLRSISELSEVSIASALEECSSYVSLCREYMVNEPLPKSLADAYNAEIMLAQSKLQSISKNVSGKSNIISQSSYTYSVIVCLYKRSTVDDVLQSLSGQTIPPSSILCLINENHIDPNMIRERYPGVLVAQSDINSLFTRWCIGYTLDGDYIFVCDDDQTPGASYIERALELSDTKRALVCGTGRRYNKDGKQGFYESISPTENNSASSKLKIMPIECDWGCNSYLFKKDWIHFILAEKRFKNYQLKIDDIQLAYNLYAYGGIKCWVAPQDSSEIQTLHSCHSSQGNDEHALWVQADHFVKRKDYLEYLIENGLYTTFYMREMTDARSIRS